jgi:hypothetical protein
VLFLRLLAELQCTRDPRPTLTLVHTLRNLCEYRQPQPLSYARFVHSFPRFHSRWINSIIDVSAVGEVPSLLVLQGEFMACTILFVGF